MTYDIYMHSKNFILLNITFLQRNPILMAAIFNYKMAVTLKLYIYIYIIYLDSGILRLLEL